MTRSRMFFLCRYFTVFGFIFCIAAAAAINSSRAQTGALIGATPDAVENTVPFPGESLGPDGNGALPPRLALVIGVANYDRADRLDIPNLPGVANDTAQVVRTLSDAGFLITEPNDNGGRVTRNGIREALNAFSSRIVQLRSTSRKKPVVLVYFGGHGVTNGADNFLIPSDFNPTFQDDLPDMALPLATIRQRLAALDVSLRYIILDACRSPFPLSLPSLSGGAAEAYKPGISKMTIETAGETIWFATLNGSTATDSGVTFTRRLLEAMDGERGNALRQAEDPRFADDGQPSPPVANAYGNTSSVLDQVATSMAGSGQVPDRAGNPPPLVLYPTRANYRTELTFFRQFEAAASPAQYERRYCLGKAYLGAFFLYSYFSGAVSDWKTKFEGLTGPADLPSCTDLAAGQPASADLPVKAATGEWLASAAPSSPPVPGEVATLGGLIASASLSDTALGEIGGFAGTTPIRTLAVAGADLPMFKYANAGGEALATVDRGQLLSVGAPNGAFIAVRTPDGRAGYVEQKLVNAGTTLLRVTVARDAGGSLTGASQGALEALKDTVVYDVAVEYREDASQNGLLLAVAAFDELRKATFIPDELVPLYRAVDPSSLPEARAVRILLSALPLDPGLRGGAFSYSGGAVNLDAALKLSQPVLITAASGHVVGQGSASGCASPLASADTAGKVAIVRYPSAGEAVAAESVRRVLGTIGFAAPDPIQKGTRIEKQGTRMTYCATDQPLVDRVKDRLSACFGDAFRYFPTSDKALCASGRLDVVVTDAALADN